MGSEPDVLKSRAGRLCTRSRHFASKASESNEALPAHPGTRWLLSLASCESAGQAHDHGFLTPHRRKVTAPHLVALVRAGATFIGGQLQERCDEGTEEDAAA